jgi:hypothetical protein
MTTQPLNRPPALRRALLLDAAASGTMGVILVLAAAPAEPLLGLAASLLRGVGIILIPFAAHLVWIAARARDPRRSARGVVWTNVLWTVASVAVLATGVLRPTLLGEIFVLAQAAVVAGFAWVEHVALRRAGVSPVAMAPDSCGDRRGQ